jgi:hypothetical protein
MGYQVTRVIVYVSREHARSYRKAMTVQIA